MASTEDNKAFVARIADMTNLCERRGMVFTHFLNEYQRFTAEAELKKLGCGNYCFFGGVDDADRTVLCVFSEYCRPENSDFPVCCVTFKYRKADKLSHRDFLGALTALNLKREAIGDILTGEGIAQVFVIESVRKTIENEVLKIGSVGVTVTSDEPVVLDKSRAYIEISGTVSSMRLDCVVSTALKMSRSKAATIVSSGIVELNYTAVSDTSFNVKQGDVFSVRGYGKFRVEEISGMTKKGRIHINVLKYC